MHLGYFAVGGAGLVMTEAAAVDPIDQLSRADIGLRNDEQAHRPRAARTPSPPISPA